MSIRRFSKRDIVVIAALALMLACANALVISKAFGWRTAALAPPDIASAKQSPL